MSGTSVDGIDAALVEVCPGGDGPLVRLLHFAECSYEAPHEESSLWDGQIPPADLQERIRGALGDPARVGVADVCSLNVEVAEAFARAAHTVCMQWRAMQKGQRGEPEEAGCNDRTERPCVGAVDFVACHGQTIWHAPKASPRVAKSTLQIGDVSVLAERTGVTCVGNFRPRDMAVGGVGAPLMPFVDAAVFGRDMTQPRMLLNVGGIANLTVLDGRGGTVAYDTGPGNMVMDEVLRVLGRGLAVRLREGRQSGIKRPRQIDEFAALLDRALERGYDVEGKLARLSPFADYTTLCRVAGKYFSEIDGVDILGQYEQTTFRGAREFLGERGPKATGREQFGLRFALELAHGVLTDGIFGQRWGFDPNRNVTCGHEELEGTTSAQSEQFPRALQRLSDARVLGGHLDAYGDALIAIMGQCLDDFEQPKKENAIEYFCGVMAMAMHLTASTVAAHVVREAEALAGTCKRLDLIVSGGGAQNALLMESIAKHVAGIVDAKNGKAVSATPTVPFLPNVRVICADALIDASGMTSDAKEAIGFALLGYCTLFGIPANMPSVTGASEPVVLGTVSPGLPSSSFNFFKFHEDGCLSATLKSSLVEDTQPR